MDEQRKVAKIEGIELSKKYKCPYVETSAKTRVNIEEVFFQIVREIDKYNANDTKQPIKRKRNTCILI